MKSRLCRLDRIYTAQLLYFLTFCTHDRKPFLAHPTIHGSFRLFAAKATTHEIFVGRYVIMPDHIHLFAVFPEHKQMSSWVRSLKNTLSKSLRDFDHPSPHWQKGFHDHLLRTEESYGAKWEYVEQNPRRKNLVEEPESWPFQGEINPLPFH
jgi:putative transposase